MLGRPNRVQMQRQSANDGGKQARSPGRARRKPLKPLRAGMPGDAGVLVVARVLFATTSAHETAGAAGIRHPPRPLWGGRFGTARTLRAARMKSYAKLHQRHCEERSDEAIHSFFTPRDGLLRCARNDGLVWLSERIENLRRRQCAPSPLAGEGWGEGAGLSMERNPSPGSHLSIRRSRSFASASFSKNGRRRRPMLSHEGEVTPSISVTSLRRSETTKPTYVACLHRLTAAGGSTSTASASSRHRKISTASTG